MLFTIVVIEEPPEILQEAFFLLMEDFRENKKFYSLGI